MQAGAGPFLGIYLQSHGWRPDTIGTVLTIGAIIGTQVTAPAGALAVWIVEGAGMRGSFDSRRDELEQMADLDASALFRQAKRPRGTDYAGPRLSAHTGD